MTSDPKELSSPACLAHEADDAYMGFATREELAAFLNELLEAERAGTGVALRSAQSAAGTPYAELLQDIHKDEARWCAMLLKQLKALGEPASSKVGAFQDKALAIAGLSERLAFLNRGQGWVVRNLKAMLRCAMPPASRPLRHAFVTRDQHRADKRRWPGILAVRRYLQAIRGKLGRLVTFPDRGATFALSRR